MNSTFDLKEKSINFSNSGNAFGFYFNIFHLFPIFFFAKKCIHNDALEVCRFYFVLFTLMPYLSHMNDFTYSLQRRMSPDAWLPFVIRASRRTDVITEESDGSIWIFIRKQKRSECEEKIVDITFIPKKTSFLFHWAIFQWWILSWYSKWQRIPSSSILMIWK